MHDRVLHHCYTKIGAYGVLGGQEKLAQAGFKIDFIPEEDTPTPDYLAVRKDVRVFVEANTRAPMRRDIAAIKDALWNVMHGDAKRKANTTRSLSTLTTLEFRRCSRSVPDDGPTGNRAERAQVDEIRAFRTSGAAVSGL